MLVGSDDTVPASNPPDDEPPEAVAGDRYQLGAELGRGGMGRVVEAFDVQLKRTVALKEVLPRGGPGIQRRFMREVQITARLEHASIVPLYDSGVTADGRPFYVMRRVTGRPLDEMVARTRGLGERLALLPAMLAAIDAVAHAHRRGVIHRDLKPANILVGELGETVVIDWGLAKMIGEPDDEGDDTIVAADSLQTQMGSVFGTPGFMPPEQARGEELGTRADVYALGATLYQLLSGKPPHAGTSATEVLSSTRNHALAPLAREAPGVPPELVAIVDKALAFDAKQRYPNAAALGEDVRRFNTGQLVAAHHYTSRQRLQRFARRNRAPLGVAALAMVAGAVLAWYGVHQIVTERDLATAAREDALNQKQAAELVRDRLVERQDTLTITRAAASLDTNPTETIAVLKGLAPSSAKLGDAKGIARAAVLRGAASVMQTSTETTISLELSPDASRLAQTTRDGLVHIWDLDRRRLMLQKTYSGFPHALWVNGGKSVLVMTQKRPPELIDLATSVSEPLPIVPLLFGEATDAGDRVVALDEHSNALLVDVSARTATPLWPGHKCGQLGIAGDGSWIMLNDDQHVVLLDATGKELTHHDGKVHFAVTSKTNKVAVMDADGIYEAPIAAGATWTHLATPPSPPTLIIYRGDHLVALLYSFDLVEWTKLGTTHPIGNVDPVFFPLVEAADDRLVVASSEGVLHVLDGLGHTILHIPAILPSIRVVARRDHSRVVAVGAGMIVDYDFDTFMPRQITAQEGSAFVDDDTILLWSQSTDDWGWYDIPSRKTTPLKFDLKGLLIGLGVEPATGRVLFVERGGPIERLVVVGKHDGVHEIAQGKALFGRLMEDNVIIFAHGTGELLASTGDGTPPRSIAKLEGTVSGLTPLGNRRYAAVSNRGEALRGNYETGDIERAHLDDATSMFVGNDHRGHPVIAADNRLLVWDRDVVEVAHFDQTIIEIEAVLGGMLVSLADHSSLVVELRPGGEQHRLLPAAHEVTAVSDLDGDTVAGFSTTAQIVVIDLPQRSRWTLPSRYEGTSVGISPNGKWILQRARDHHLLWQLPMPSADLSAWYDEQTNATEDVDGLLTWPWQTPAKP